MYFFLPCPWWGFGILLLCFFLVLRTNVSLFPQLTRGLFYRLSFLFLLRATVEGEDYIWCKQQAFSRQVATRKACVKDLLQI